LILKKLPKKFIDIIKEMYPISNKFDAMNPEFMIEYYEYLHDALDNYSEETLNSAISNITLLNLNPEDIVRDIKLNNGRFVKEFYLRRIKFGKLRSYWWRNLRNETYKFKPKDLDDIVSGVI